MKKKIISALVLIGLLVTPMAAYADAAVGDQIVTIGTNLTQQQRQEVLSYFGAKDNAQIIDVDISEERQYLSGKVPDAQIGNSTNSCAMITYTTKGSGVNVTTHNINYVTPDAYKSAILTAGIVLGVKGKDLAELRCIPQEEYAAASKLMAESTAAWHEAKPRSDFSIFAPYLEKVIETKKRFAHYVKPDIDPYEYYLDTYEPGLTRRKCDEFFAALRARVVPLLRRVQAARQVDASFLTGDFPLEAQRKLSDELMEIMRIDRSFCSIGETEHPFTTNFTKRDVRITTHYYPDNAVSSMYSVIHEGGHALYELHTADEDMYNGLGSGVSMGIHESQSRFYENLVGRSRGFVTFLAPRLRALFPQQLGGVSDDALYRAVNRCEASLVRTEADELTYSLHIMVRYEIEKKLFADEISVAEIPQEWNRLYQEYLGVTPSCDRDGCLQDSHWSDGSFGYFPSYALGSAYGAQMLPHARDGGRGRLREKRRPRAHQLMALRAHLAVRLPVQARGAA
mgnify:CR=1 FL=1